VLATSYCYNGYIKRPEMRGTRTQQRRKYVRHVGQIIYKHNMLLYLPLFTVPSSVLRFVYGLLLIALRYSLKNVLAHVEIIVVKVKLILHIMIIYFYRDYCSATRWRFARSYTICWSLWGWYCWCQCVRFQFVWEECHQRYEKTLARRHYSLCHLKLFQ